MIRNAGVRPAVIHSMTFHRLGDIAATVIRKTRPMIERISIQNREQWLSLRRYDITASVAGALLGVHPYATAYSLHLLKSGLIDDDVEETAPMRRGKLLEPVAVQVLREERPDWSIQPYPVGYYLRDGAARLGATPDLYIDDENGRHGVVQFKSVEPSVFRREWKAEGGAIDPPLWIVCQAIVEAYLTGAECAFVAAMVVSFGVELHVVEIPIHAGIIDRIKGEVAKFWQQVEAKTPPPMDYAQDGRLLAKLHPKDNGGTVDLSGDNRTPELVAELEAWKASIKDAEFNKVKVETEIKEKLGDNTFGRLGDGRVISWKAQTRKAHEVKESTFRVLRVLNGRGA